MTFGPCGQPCEAEAPEVVDVKMRALSHIPPMSTHSIFLNYRRIETQKDARHLYRELLRHFPEQIFMDAPGTAGGQHFPDLLRRKVQECRVLVAVIGPEWHRLADSSGRVRLEIATAMQRGIPVIPALIDGARMPVAEQVPEVLRGLLNHQAVKLDLDDFFEASIEKLCVAIRLGLRSPNPSGPSGTVHRTNRKSRVGMLNPGIRLR